MHGCGLSLQPALKSVGGGAVAQLEARLDGIEEVVGSNPIGSTKSFSAALFCPRNDKNDKVDSLSLQVVQLPR